MRSFVLAVVALGVGIVGAADDPPKKLSTEEQNKLGGKADTLFTSGQFAVLNRDFEAAEKAYREALDLYKLRFPGEDNRTVARTMNNLAFVLEERRKYDEAEQYHRAALEMRLRLYKDQDNPEVANSLSNLGYVLEIRGKYEEAFRKHRDALAMRQRLYKNLDHLEVAVSLEHVAGLLENMGRYADANPHARDALAMWRRLHKGKDHPDLAQGIANFATFISNRGRHAEAALLFREALEMRQRLYKDQDHPEVAGSLHNLAAALDDLSHYAEAESIARDSLAMWRRLYKDKDHPNVATALNNLAYMLMRRGRYAEAESLYQDALALRQRLYTDKDHPDVAKSLGSLGTVRNRRGNFAGAEPCYRDALAMLKRFHGKRDHQDVAVTLNNLGHFLTARGKYVEAEDLHAQALAMTRRLHKNEDHLSVVAKLNNLANLHHSRGSYTEAQSHYQSALDMARRLYVSQDHETLGVFLSNQAAVLSAQGKYAEAEPLYRDSLRMFARLAAEYAGSQSEGEALTLAASFPLARDAFLSNARLNRTDPETVYAEVWATKANVGRVAERRALAARSAGNVVAGALLADLTGLRLRRQELLLAPMSSDPATRKERGAVIDGLTRRITAESRVLPAFLPAVDRLDRLERTTPADLRAALPPNTVFVDIIEYTRFEQDPKKPGATGEQRTPSYAAFVVTRDGIKWRDLGSSVEIDKVVRLWREAITTVPYTVPRDIPNKLRELVWAKVRAEFPAKTEVVYVSPDAALTGVPWAALPGDRPGDIVLEEFAVAVVPHGPALLGALWPRDPRPDPPTGFLAVGGVGFGDRPDRPAVGLSAALTRGEPLLDARNAPLWGNLRGAKQEAERLVLQARGRKLPTRLLSGKEASVDWVLAELPKARYAHLATHGFFADPQFRSVLRVDPDLFRVMRGGEERIGRGAVNPMVLSGLVLAGANRPDTPGRGILTGDALPDRDLSGLELVVLSACQTGLGEVAGGEGVFGLQRAFHLAGARNVVASLWKVPDAATAALMLEFYKAHWDDSLPPVRALQKAQLAVYRATPAALAAMVKRGVEDGDENFDIKKALAETPLNPGGKNPPFVWAAFTVSGAGR